MVASSTVRHPLQIGDKTYDVSPLTDEARENLDEWVRSKFVERASKLIEQMRTDSDKELGFKVAFRQAASLSWLSGEGAKMIATVDGMARMLYEGIRPNHPEVEYEALRKECFDPSIIMRVNATFNDLHGRNQTEKKLAPRGKSLSPKKKST